MKDILPLAIEGTALQIPLVIAGPCSAESRSQVLDTAVALAGSRVNVFRAGVWKPRTRPGGFEGIGLPALEWLAEVKAVTGMRTATEVATRTHVEQALTAGIDLLWIGARTSANPFAMQELADTIGAINPDVPVLVKNPVSPDLELWIGAMQRLYNAGIRRLGAIHRGFPTYGDHEYRNNPLWRIPLEFRTRLPHVPLICDPSHIGGRRDLVEPLCHESLDMGFDGLMIECHCDPANALSDAAQQLTPVQLKEMLARLVWRSNPARQENLAELRERIDRLDDRLLEVLAARMGVSREIGEYKRINNIPVVQSSRFGDLLEERRATARSLGLSDEFVNNIFSAIHEASVQAQLKIGGK